MYARIQPPRFPEKRLDVQAWLRARESHANLGPSELQLFRNPLDSEFFVYDTPHSAEVVVDGETFGLLMFEDGALSVDGEPDIVNPVAYDVADSLGCELLDEDGKPLPRPTETDLEAIAESLRKDADLPPVEVRIHKRRFENLPAASEFARTWKESDGDDDVTVREERRSRNSPDVEVIHRWLTDDGRFVDVGLRKGRVATITHGWLTRSSEP